VSHRRRYDITSTEEVIVYDAHMHVSSDAPAEALQILDACGIARAAIMNKGYGREHPNEEHARWEQRDLDGYMPRKPGYTMRGVNLPPGVLDKIYRENAARVILGW
jgi:hypothetical protein